MSGKEFSCEHFTQMCHQFILEDIGYETEFANLILRLLTKCHLTPSFHWDVCVINQVFFVSFPVLVEVCFVCFVVK